MATKKSTMRDDVLKTTAKAASTEEEEKPKPYGVYLNKPMRADVEQIQAELGMKTHALLQFAIKYFIQQYKAGKVKMKTETVTRPEL